MLLLLLTVTVPESVSYVIVPLLFEVLVSSIVSPAKYSREELESVSVGLVGVSVYMLLVNTPTETLSEERDTIFCKVTVIYVPYSLIINDSGVIVSELIVTLSTFRKPVPSI